MRKEKQRYYCPGKLQRKFLVAFWTVPEGLLIVFTIILGAYLWIPLIGFALGAAVCTARFDLERSLMSKVFMRVRYYRQVNTFRRM